MRLRNASNAIALAARGASWRSRLRTSFQSVRLHRPRMKYLVSHSRGIARRRTSASGIAGRIAAWLRASASRSRPVALPEVADRGRPPSVAPSSGSNHGDEADGAQVLPHELRALLGPAHEALARRCSILSIEESWTPNGVATSPPSYSISRAHNPAADRWPASPRPASPRRIRRCCRPPSVARSGFRKRCEQTRLATGLPGRPMHACRRAGRTSAACRAAWRSSRSRASCLRRSARRARGRGRRPRRRRA